MALVHRRTAALVGALVPVVAVAPAIAGGDHHGDPGGSWDPSRFSGFSGQVTDLSPTTDDPTDGITAQVGIVRGKDGSLAGIRLSGFDPAEAGRSFGAHLHTGPCVAGDPEAAGPHYNTDVASGVTPPEVGPSTELWFDLTVLSNGEAADGTGIPFVVPAPADGAGSIVLHETTTDGSGDAGARTACIPLS